MLTNLVDRLATERREILALLPLIYNENCVGENVMSKRIKYSEGQILGDHGIIFVREVMIEKGKSRRALFKCHCGNEYITGISSVKSSSSKSCGCNQNRKKCYEEGQIVGSNGFIFLKDIGDKLGSERKALVRCKCGKEYISKISPIANDHTKSCGCSMKEVDRSNYKKVCVDCGKEFKAGVRALYCEECKTRTCVICGREFIAKLKSSKTGKWPMYCSIKCSREGHIGFVPWNKGLTKYITIQCKNCSKDMVVKDHKRKKKFCSDKCKYEYHVKIGTYRRAEKTQPWRKYIAHTRKYKEWRKSVLIRDGGVCRECWGKKHIKNRKNLEVHHIIPIYDDKTKMFKLWNGITLCRKCHRKTINHEAEFSGYYFNLLEQEPIKVNKQWCKNINPNLIIRKLELGYTRQQIAKHFQICLPTINKQIKDCDLPKKWIKPKKCTFYSILSLCTKGNSIKKIAKLMSIDQRRIVEILKLWGNNLNTSGLKGKGLTGNVLRRTTHLTNQQLASIFNVHLGTVTQYRKKHGFGSWERALKKFPHNIFSPIQHGYTLYSILKLYTSGLKMYEIAKIVHTEQKRVAQVLKLWGNNLTKRQTSLKGKGLTNNVLRRCKHLKNTELTDIFNIDYASISRNRAAALINN